MDAPDDSDAWAHQCELEGRRLQEELARDPGYLEWLEMLESQRNEQQRKETNDGDYCF